MTVHNFISFELFFFFLIIVTGWQLNLIENEIIYGYYINIMLLLRVVILVLYLSQHWQTCYSSSILQVLIGHPTFYNRGNSSAKKITNNKIKDSRNQ